MNQKIKKVIADYINVEPDKLTDGEIFETLCELKYIFEEPRGEHRWWFDYFCVVELGGILIGFYDAHANGDESAENMGWEFDPETVCEVKAVEKMVTVYEPVK